MHKAAMHTLNNLKYQQIIFLAHSLYLQSVIYSFIINYESLMII